NLEEVEVKFARECAFADPVGQPGHALNTNIAETISFRNEVLEFLFTALRQDEKVKSLTIKNLQDYMDKSVFESEDFKAVRNELSKLHLQITTEHDQDVPEYSILDSSCHQGFRRDRPDTWLKLLTNQLTCLTLYGTECFWGVWPLVDFRQVPAFPYLKSLSLGKFTIAHEWQVDWVLSHRPTLEELILDDCPIVTALTIWNDAADANFPGL
ncbi:hypothetical protein BKA66DRAFT_395877, partial [Pyrenochaeta sp. MPI-SDFR-AT-0127]